MRMELSMALELRDGAEEEPGLNSFLGSIFSHSVKKEREGPALRQAEKWD